jgi:hypothetical protein
MITEGTQWLLLIGSIPVFIVAIVASYYKWREDHPRHNRHHAAE